MATNSIITSVTGTDTSSNRIGSTFYGTCDTAKGTAQKDVTLADSCVFDDNCLVTGVTIHVKFTNSNTHATPTLRVGTATAKQIMRYGTTKPSTSTTTSWYAGSVVSLTYDGTYWIMNDYKFDAYTVSQTRTNDADAEYCLTYGATAGDTTATEGLRKSNKLTFNPSSSNLKINNASGINVIDMLATSANEGSIVIKDSTGTIESVNLYSAGGEGAILLHDTNNATKTILYGDGSIECINLNSVPVSAYLNSMGEVTTPTDANNIRTNGIYGTNGGNITNCPSSWGTLICMSFNTDQTVYSGRTQLFITSGGYLYTRSCWDGNNWSSWLACTNV